MYMKQLIHRKLDMNPKKNNPIDLINLQRNWQTKRLKMRVNSRRMELDCD